MQPGLTVQVWPKPIQIEVWPTAVITVKVTGDLDAGAFGRMLEVRDQYPEQCWWF